MTQEQNKTYVISDVHGCYHTLLNLINKLPKNSNLIFVGDLCDRGLYSKEVISFVLKNKYQVVLGNHDNYMLEHAMESLEGIDNRWFREDYMGGEQTMQNYTDEEETLFYHLEWLKTLPKYLLIDKYFITHGFGLPYFKRRYLESSKEGLLKNRVSDEKEWGQDWEKSWNTYDVINIFGHTHYDTVESSQNYFGIDTGCVYGNKLTAIELGSMKVFNEQLDLRDIDK